VKVTRVFSLQIPPGAQSGERLPLAPGLFASLEVAEHPLFRRRGADLRVKAKISLLQALCGFDVRVRHLDGRELSVSGGQIIRPGDVCLLEGEGIPRGKGNLEVEVEIEFPRHLGEDQVATLRSCLGGCEKKEDSPASSASFANFFTNPPVVQKSVLNQKQEESAGFSGGGPRPPPMVQQCRPQ